MKFYQDSIKDGLFDRLHDLLDQRFCGHGDDKAPFPEWVKGTILDGKPFTYGRHEYLIEPYNDDCRIQVEGRRQLNSVSPPGPC